MKRVAVVLLLLVLIAGLVCAQKVQTGRERPDPWVPITALPSYREWWAKNEACLTEIPKMDLLDAVTIPAYHVPLDSLHWYVAGSVTFINPAGRIVYGQFLPPDTVVLAGKMLQDERLVRHELLHVMGWNFHPLVPFRFPCGVE